MEEGALEINDPSGEKQIVRTRHLSGSQLFSMSLAVVVESAHITIAYTIGVYMVRHFLAGSSDQRQVGTLTGLLSSFYSLGQLVTAFGWGMASDRFGRKYLIVMSNFFSTVSMLAFGLADNYTGAAFARLIGGFFNCSFTNVRSMIGESTDFTSQAVAFGYLGLAFGVGTVLGPLIGGSLASPCEEFGPRFPLCGPGQLNAARPFFLPCLGAALVSGFAAASNALVLRETLPAIVEARRARAEAAAAKQAPLKQPLLAGRERPDLEDGAGEQLRDALVEGGAGQPGGGQLGGTNGMEAPRPTLRSQPSFNNKSPADVPWMQVGTPFTMTCEVSASVADDITEFEAGNPGQVPVTHYVVGSPGGRFFQRLSMDARQTTLAASDVEPYEAFDARGGGGGGGGQIRHPIRRLPPQRVSLLSRAIPRPVPSAFADPVLQEQAQEGGTGSAELPASMPTPRRLSSIDESRAAELPAGEAVSAQPEAAAKPAGGEDAAAAVELEWFKDPRVILGIAGYTCICFMFNMLDELTPIFAAAPEDRGGLNFSSSELSLPLSVSGAALMVWSLFCFPPIQARLGARLCACSGLAATVLLSVALGATSFLPGRGVSHDGVVAALLVIMVLKACSQQMCFPTSMAIVNRFSPPSKRGAVNGTAQTLASAVRALGPALGGYMWAVFSGLAAPGHQLIPFIIISACSAATIALYKFLPPV